MFTYEELKYMSDSEWKREMKEIRGQMYWKPGPWIKEKLDVAKWQLLLWRDFKVYIHKTRKKKNATMLEYLNMLKEEYALKSVGM